MSLAATLERLEQRAATRWQKIPVRALRIILALLEQCSHDKILIRASGLAYSTLLAIVPLIAVLFSLFSAFSAFDDVKDKVQDLLFSQLLPTSQVEVVEYINTFTENARTLGILGFLVLIITAILLLDNVESNFNELWHVRRRRRIINKFTAYTSVLVFGTLFIGASLSISAQIKAFLFTGRLIDTGTLMRIGTWIFPFLLTLTAFVLMFQIIPYTRVRFRSAFIGALVAALLWEAGKHLFAVSIGQSVRYSAIYGSIAVIPIFLIWIYITWVIVLLGLEVSYTHQYHSYLVLTGTTGPGALSEHLTLTLKLFTAVAHRYDAGRPPPTARELADRFKVPLERVEDHARLLSESGLLRGVAGGSRHQGYVPARSLEQIMVSDVLRAVLRDAEGSSVTSEPLERTVEAALDRFLSAGHEALGSMNCLELVRGISGKTPGI